MIVHFSPITLSDEMQMQARKTEQSRLVYNLLLEIPKFQYMDGISNGAIVDRNYDVSKQGTSMPSRITVGLGNLHLTYLILNTYVLANVWTNSKKIARLFPGHPLFSALSVERMALQRMHQSSDIDCREFKSWLVDVY